MTKLDIKPDLSISTLTNCQNFLTKSSFSSSSPHIKIFSTLQDKITKNKHTYIQLESYKLISFYGFDIYFYSKSLEHSHPPKKFLSRHKVTSFVRSKMVDWMLEVLNAYHTSTQTFFLSVQLFDAFLSFTPKILKDSNVHLLGITCMFIASKFEDTYPIQLYQATQKISHNKFNERQVKSKEIEILSVVDCNLIEVTTFDFICIYLYDFYANNKENIDMLNLREYIECLENIAIFLAKMICLDEDYSHIK